MAGRLRHRVTGLVLSGGGAKGAYEVGVMKALFEGASPSTGYEPLDAEVFTGTSVGSLNGTFMASQPEGPSAQGLARLEDLWRRRIANTPSNCGNGIFRVRGLPFQGLDPGCLSHPVESGVELLRDGAFFLNAALVRGLNFVTSQGPVRNRIAEAFDLSALFSTAPLDSLVREAIDLDSLRASRKKLTIAASNWKDGKLKMFSKEEIADKVGTQAVLASAAIPGIFHPIVIGDVPYVDGGVLNNTPLRPAIKDGAEEIHIIYLDPQVEDIPFPQLPNTLDTTYRLYAVNLAANFRNDLVTTDGINRALELVGAAGDGGPDLSAAPGPREERAFRFLRRIAQRPRTGGRAYRRVLVHRYRPTTDLGGALGLLDFRSQNIDSLIEVGYRDAVNHDCDESECSIPLGFGRARRR